jgi:hypothetical protein
VHAFVEVFAGLAIAASDVVGHVGAEKTPDLVEEGPIVLAQIYAGEVH